MKIKIIRTTFVGGVAVKPNAVIDVDQAEGRSLISLGKAVPVSEAPKRAPKNRMAKPGSTRDGEGADDDDDGEGVDGDGDGDGADDDGGAGDGAGDDGDDAGGDPSSSG